MFSQNEVKCPVTQNGRARFWLHPEVVRQLNGLLRTQRGLEWAAIGKGWTAHGGSVVYVTSLWFPPQSRGPAWVDIKEHDLEADDVVVFHSHHGMGAFWSDTDRTRLNPRYPASIVVAELEKDQAVTGYGFDYKATALVRLPCGSLGRMEGELVSVKDIIKLGEGQWIEGSPSENARLVQLNELAWGVTRLVVKRTYTREDFNSCPHKEVGLTVDRLGKLTTVACAQEWPQTLQDYLRWADPLEEVITPLSPKEDEDVANALLKVILPTQRGEVGVYVDIDQPGRGENFDWANVKWGDYLDPEDIYLKEELSDDFDPCLSDYFQEIKKIVSDSSLEEADIYDKVSEIICSIPFLNTIVKEVEDWDLL